MSEGLVHHGIELRFDGEPHRIALTELTGGRSIMVYGQQEVVKDLIQARLDAGGQVLFERRGHRRRRRRLGAPNGALSPGRRDARASGRRGRRLRRLPRRLPRCIPPGALTAYEREYPFAWLGILAEAPPVHRGVVYAYNERGFALHSMRSPTISRLYLQVRAQRGRSTIGPTTASGTSYSDASPPTTAGRSRAARSSRRASRDA